MKQILLMLLAFFGEWNEAEEIAAGQAILAVVQSAKPRAKVTAEYVKPRHRQIVAVTAEGRWCSPCNEFKDVSAVKLGRAGWTFGANGHIRYAYATDEVCEELDIVALPTFILLVDGVEIDRHEGFADPWQIGRLYKSKGAK